MNAKEDTICALSSGGLPAAIAVVRASGPEAGKAVLTLAGRLPPARHATLMRLCDPGCGDPIDDALVLWFPGPRSETGEDVAEFHLHGGRAVVAATLEALAGISGVRMAERGEFSRRAFVNGKLDLTAVEGLADLIGADTAAQRRQAFRQLSGMLCGKSERWRASLIEALALVEVTIDFSDEGDVPEDLLGPVQTIVAELKGEIEGLLADRGRGERLRDGLRVAIAGPANVGKSSILNRLARRPAAIVSPHAGTTRDVIEVHLDLCGCPVTVLDTAGLRETDDPNEQEGIRLAQERSADADLVLWTVDATNSEPPAPPPGLQGAEGPAVWVVTNKCDLVDHEPLESAQRGRESFAGYVHYQVSAKTGASFDALLAGLAGFADGFFGSGEPALITRQRHRGILISCVKCLEGALAELSRGREEAVAEELRLATRELGRLTGRIDVEDVLDVIFRDFCIGK